MKITRPTLVLDIDRCQENIDRISSRNRSKEILFRPHFKTHQSNEIGQWFKQRGVRQISVSSVSMARYFADHGWKDILIAIPFNIRELDELKSFPEDVLIHCAIDKVEIIESISAGVQRPVGIYIEMDDGYHRTGLGLDSLKEIENILQIIHDNKYLSFTGYFTHSGKTYQTRNKREIQDIYERSVKMLEQIQFRFSKYFPDAIISVSDTPSMSVLDDLGPGNFIFYDLMQHQLGSCSINDIALAVACPVISKNKERLEIVIYGGAVHLSKEFLPFQNYPKVFGLVCPFGEKGWGEPFEGTCVVSLSQEHGIIKTNKKVYHQIKLGDVVAILPVHSCLTANLYSFYFAMQTQKKIFKFQSH